MVDWRRGRRKSDPPRLRFGAAGVTGRCSQRFARTLTLAAVCLSVCTSSWAQPSAVTAPDEEALRRLIPKADVFEVVETESRGVLYRDLTGAAAKVLVTMECATHFAVWETSQYKFMHRASLEWLRDGTYRGQSTGIYRVGVDGAETSGE